MMRWRKLGLIFRPDKSRWWTGSHAALPVPVQLDGSFYRVFFSGRDHQNRSHVGYFDIDLNRPEKTVRIAQEPVLAPGPLGHFDDHGVYAASAVRHDGVLYLYTIGWNRGMPAPLFYSSIGLAISRDGGDTFEKLGRAPILARSNHDPCLVTSPFVLKEEGRWRMWYVSGIGWEAKGELIHSIYHVKYAESDDGTDWRRDGTVCIDLTGGERNIARTCVLRFGGRYSAWFSSDRGEGYRMGFAESVDGISWVRRGEPEGLAPSREGWDSRAMTYPFVVLHDRALYMFYNGNDFGRDGIGLAVSDPVPSLG